MPLPAISVIIVNHNGESYLNDCLRALSHQTFTDFEVIVVDNGSTDNSREFIKTAFSWVKVIPLSENSGFARGNNIGIEASSSKYIATLNNDTIVDKDWLRYLHEAAEADEKIGMVASKILLGRDGSEIDSVGMLIYPDGMSRQRGRGEKDTGQFDGLSEILFPSACAALYRRDMLEEIGLFDEDFFLYCEDADLGLRARIQGWKAVLAPKAIVRHLYSQTSGKYSEFKAYHVERNRLWVLIKNFPLDYIVTFPFYTVWRYIIPAYGLLSGKGSVARFAEGTSKGEMVRVLLKAYKGALVKFSAMLKKRNQIRNSGNISFRDYRALLKKHRISAQELMLRE
jgi:GT2 family glycosyltransferase